MPAERVLMYIVYHDEASRAEAEAIAAPYPWMFPLAIENGKYMESEVFRQLLHRREEWENAEYVGLLKHSFLTKSPFYDFPKIPDIYPGMDLYTFVNGQERDHTQIPMIISAAWSHPLFHVIWFHLLSRMNVHVYTMFNQHIPGFYSNFWIARKPFFAAYLQFFEAARTLMDTDTFLRELLFQNASYEFSKLSSEEHARVTGVPHPTYHCFIAERLACFFFYASAASIFPVGGPHRQADPALPRLPMPSPSSPLLL